MVNIQALIPFGENNPAVIYLPFTPSLFNQAYCKGEHSKHFEISPMYKTELSKNNHKLNFMSVEHSHTAEMNFSTKEQDKYTQCTRKDIMNYSKKIFVSYSLRVKSDVVGRNTSILIIK